MLNLQEIRNYYFEKAGNNRYRAEDVDNFKTQVVEFVEKLIRDNNEMAKKLSAASDKLEEYREQEDSIRSALLNAQRLGDTIVRESKAKSESLINQANEKSDQIIEDANAKADKIVNDAKDSIVGEQETLRVLKNEVSQFRSKLLDIYRKHLELINDIPKQKPSYDETEEEGEAEQVEAQTEPTEVTEVIEAEVAEETVPQDDEQEDFKLDLTDEEF